MVGWIYIYIFDPEYFVSGNGGIEMLYLAPRRHQKKIFQTEIDFDVWSRLPLATDIQNMNPFRVGLGLMVVLGSV